MSKQIIEQLQKQLADAQALTEKLQRELEEASKPKQWEPEGGEWFIKSYGDVESGISSDGFRLFGTERKTKEQAHKAAKAMRTFNRLLAYRDQFDPDFEEVWDGMVDNYYVDYDPYNEVYSTNYGSSYKNIGVVYMSESVAEELAEKLNNGSVVL